MRSGIENCTSYSSRSNEGTSSNADKDDGPCGKKGNNINLSLLASVGEVVVSCAHVIESTSVVHLYESTIKVSVGSVKLHAILNVGFNVVLIVGILGKEIGERKTVGLSKH